MMSSLATSMDEPDMPAFNRAKQATIRRQNAMLQSTGAAVATTGMRGLGSGAGGGAGAGAGGRRNSSLRTPRRTHARDSDDDDTHVASIRELRKRVQNKLVGMGFHPGDARRAVDHVSDAELAGPTRRAVVLVLNRLADRLAGRPSPPAGTNETYTSTAADGDHETYASATSPGGNDTSAAASQQPQLTRRPSRRQLAAARTQSQAGAIAPDTSPRQVPLRGTRSRRRSSGSAGGRASAVVLSDSSSDTGASDEDTDGDDHCSGSSADLDRIDHGQHDARTTRRRGRRVVAAPSNNLWFDTESELVLAELDKDDAGTQRFEWPLADMDEFVETSKRGRAIDLRCVVVVTNLPVVPVAREHALRNLVAKYFLFSSMEPVRTVKLPVNRLMGTTKGVAFVEFSSEAATKAAAVTDSTSLNGWRLQARRFVEHVRYQAVSPPPPDAASGSQRQDTAASSSPSRGRQPRAVKVSTSRAWGSERRKPGSDGAGAVGAGNEATSGALSVSDGSAVTGKTSSAALLSAADKLRAASAALGSNDTDEDDVGAGESKDAASGQSQRDEVRQLRREVTTMSMETTRLTKLLRAAERRAQLMERSSQLNEKAQKQAEDALRTERNARQEALRQYQALKEQQAELVSKVSQFEARQQEALHYAQDAERSLHQVRERTGKMLRRWSRLGSLMGGGLPGVQDLAAATDLDPEAEFTEDELCTLEKQLSTALAAVRKQQMDALRAKARNAQRELMSKKDQRLCVVCTEREKDAALVPCGHLCMCAECARRPEITRCPMCRADVHHVMDVFM